MVTAVRRRTGRPAQTRHGTLAARHRSGRAVGWSDGQWAGDPALVARARALTAAGTLLAVPGTGGWVEADADTALAAYAVLLDLCGPDAAMYGDIPDGALTWLTGIALTDPDSQVDAEVDGDV